MADEKTVWEQLKVEHGLDPEASDDDVAKEILAKEKAYESTISQLKADYDAKFAALSKQTEKKVTVSEKVPNEDIEIPVEAIPNVLDQFQELKDELNQVKAESKAKDEKVKQEQLYQKLTKAIAEGKVLPKEEAMYRTLAKTDPGLFDEFLSRAVPYRALATSQSNMIGLHSASDAENLSQSQIDVCSILGLQPKQFSKQLGDERIAASALIGGVK